MGFDLGQFQNMDKAKAVWDKMDDKSWPGLIDAIGKVRAEQGNDEMLDAAEQKARDAEAEGKAFPDNPMDLMKHLG